MNYQKLLEMQDKLDTHIMKNHKLQFIKLSKAVLATIIELSEAVNDEQSFKYWKVNNQPKPTLIEEIADFTHFLTHLSNRFNVTAEDITNRGMIKHKELDEHFICMFHTLSMIGLYPKGEEKRKHVLILWSLFKGLWEHLGFTENDVFQAYLKKNKINYERQETNY